MNLVLRTLTALAAPPGPAGRLSIFYFHRVLERPDPLLPSEPDARMFDRILSWIGAQFRVLDPLRACEMLYDGSLPSRPAVITFDDGYRDNCTVALPILRAHGMTAGFFVATGFLQGGTMFNDRVIEAVRHWSDGAIEFSWLDDAVPMGSLEQRRAAIDRLLAVIKYQPPDEREATITELERAARVPAGQEPMMRPEHVRELAAAGMTVGGHTRTHPILTKIDDARARAEIGGSLEDLADILGERPQMFAYPNGKPGADFDERHARFAADAGCRFGFTTDARPATLSSEPMMIPRFTPWDRSRLKFQLRALLNLRRFAHTTG